LAALHAGMTPFQYSRSKARGKQRSNEKERKRRSFKKPGKKTKKEKISWSRSPGRRRIQGGLFGSQGRKRLQLGLNKKMSLDPEPGGKKRPSRRYRRKGNKESTTRFRERIARRSRKGGFVNVRNQK